MQKQPPENFCKKAVFKNFDIFTAKHLCWRLFNSQYCEIFHRTYFEEHLRKTASDNVHGKC